MKQIIKTKKNTTNSSVDIKTEDSFVQTTIETKETFIRIVIYNDNIELTTYGNMLKNKNIKVRYGKVAPKIETECFYN
jgi:hypothetical protein